MAEVEAHRASRLIDFNTFLKMSKVVTEQLAAQAKPLMKALNISTCVNLFGYGYRNVYELNELVKVNDPRVAFEGTIVEQKPAPLAPPGTK